MDKQIFIGLCKEYVKSFLIFVFYSMSKHTLDFTIFLEYFRHSVSLMMLNKYKK